MSGTLDDEAFGFEGVDIPECGILPTKRGQRHGDKAAGINFDHSAGAHAVGVKMSSSFHSDSEICRLGLVFHGDCSGFFQTVKSEVDLGFGERRLQDSRGVRGELAFEGIIVVGLGDFHHLAAFFANGVIVGEDLLSDDKLGKFAVSE